MLVDQLQLKLKERQEKQAQENEINQSDKQDQIATSSTRGSTTENQQHSHQSKRQYKINL